MSYDRKYDRPSFTLSAFLPPHVRTFYIALRSLNVALSMIPDTTSTPTIAAMRMQFWRDTISKTLDPSKAVPKEPIAILLSSALTSLEAQNTQSSSPRTRKAWFLRMISAREQYLSNTPFTSLSALETYAESTYSTLLYLTLSAFPLSSMTTDHLASHIGKAAGITTVLRGLPLLAFPPPANHHSNQGQFGLGLNQNTPGGSAAKQPIVTLPLDIMSETGLREEDVFRHGADAPGLRDAVFAVATRASDHLITARTMLSNLRKGLDVGHAFEHSGEEGHEYEFDSPSNPESSRSQPRTQLDEVEAGFGALMPAVSTALWLEQLQKVDFDVFHPSLRTAAAVGGWRLPWRSYWAWRGKKF